MSEESEQSKLSEEDLNRVNEYLNSPVHQVERRPFRPALLMIMVVVSLTVLSGLSLLLGRLVLGE